MFIDIEKFRSYYAMNYWKTGNYNVFYNENSKTFMSGF